MGKRRIVASTCALVAFGGMAAIAGPAAADPRQAPDQTAVIDCGSGPVDVVVAGNGPWTPAHLTGSTAVYVPVAFGEGTSSFVVLDGPHAGVTGEGPAQPASAKGGVRKGQSAMECTYQISGTFFEPNFAGTISFTATGTVWVQVTKG